MNDFLKGILFIVFILCGLYYIDLNEKERELKKVEIVRQAENSQDPYLKEKAERIKIEMREREQAQNAKKEAQEWNDEEKELAKSFVALLGWVFGVIGIGIVAYAFNFVKRTKDTKYG